MGWWSRSLSQGALCLTLSLVYGGSAPLALAQSGSLPLVHQMGTAPDGLPILCARTPGGDEDPAEASEALASVTALPAGTRGWECIPGVIRADGIDTFRLEVNTNGPVQGVSVSLWTFRLIGPSASPIALRDDGVVPDLVAGDFIFTAGPFRYDPSFPFFPNYHGDPASPVGLDMTDLGPVEITEQNGAKSSFLVEPGIAFIASYVPLRSVAQLTPSLAFSKHVINVATSTRETQKFLRFLGGDKRNLTLPIYQHLPDYIHFLMLFSTYKIEHQTQTAGPNFVAGVHTTIRVDYTGTGRAPFNNSGFYGSNGVLMSINALDAYDRGIYSSNITHELEHQWGVDTSTSLGLNDGGAHYVPRCSVGSLLGGQRWDSDGSGQWILNCDEGRMNGAHRASPLDLYLMGLLAGTGVPDMYIYSSSSPTPNFRCGQVINDIVKTVTIGQIQGLHGVRAPGPATAQRHFNIGFIAESNGRLLNATEMTFYDMLAEHYTSAVPPGDPDPYIAFSWPSITRFFGTDVTWSSAVRQKIDFDRDGDVDENDIDIFAGCAGRAEIHVTPSCAASDLDGDGDSDPSDFGIMQRCYSGSGRPPDPTCSLQ